MLAGRTKLPAKEIVFVTRDKQIIFLGGLLPEEQYELIEHNTKGTMQNAADRLQKKLLYGFEAVYSGDIVVVNIPFIGSYPQRFNLPFLPGCNSCFSERIDVRSQGFCCLKFIKPFSRFRAALVGLHNEVVDSSGNVVVYSAHLPFIIAALVFRGIFKGDVHLCLILPDLPWFMGEGGILYRIFKAIERKIFCCLAKKFDSYVLLTKAMADAIPIAINKITIIEGVSEQQKGGPPAKNLKDTNKVFTFAYTGTLAERYGIMDLLKAFNKIQHDNINLLICGEGECRDQLLAMSEVDKRIKYMGQVSADKARYFQETANVLVNPRSSRGEYTKYSFPSKIMEYMSTGRPVLMYRLPGIPDEYYEYCLAIDEGLNGGLRKSMIDAIEMPAHELTMLGSAAQKFVYEKKSPMVQCKKIVDLFDANTNAN